MDDKWFKQRQKLAGVTAEDIARHAGKSRSNVSHIYTGKQKMSLAWARAFSDVLGVPIDEVLRRAGVVEGDERPVAVPGFADGDVAEWQGKDADRRGNDAIAAAMGGGRAGVDVWVVQGDALILGGYLPGDCLLVDTGLADRCVPGDIVIAQKYNWQQGTATTLLRRFEPPVLVAASASPDDQRVCVVDGDNVAIRGKVIASWRGNM